MRISGMVAFVVFSGAALAGCSVETEEGEFLRTTTQAAKEAKKPKNKKDKPDPCEDPVKTPLSRAACRSGKLIGSAVDPTVEDEKYAEILASEFNAATPENVMKWGPLQPEKDRWDFTQADAFVAIARRNGQAIKGHTLVWHQQLPGFVTPGIGKKELKKLLQKHIKTVTQRYRNDVAAWDVVNEAVADDGSLRQSVFLDAFGPDYIADAFHWAAESTKSGCSGKGARLLYNDYGIIDRNPKSDAVHALLERLLAKGAPIDGIGFQGHIDARSAPSVESITQNFQRFAKLGLELNVSELDVRVAGIPGSRAEKLALQQEIYHRVGAACAQTKACTGITVWGVGDAYSWIDGTFGADDPLLFDDELNRKPAYRGLVDGLLGLAAAPSGAAPNLVSSGSFETDAEGWFGFGSGTGSLSAAAHTGRAAFVSGVREATWQGPAFDLTRLVQPGFEYAASAFVKVLGASGAPLQLSLKTKCSGAENYPTIGSVTASEASFSQVSGTFAVPYCDLEEVYLYFQGPEPGIDIVIDDVTVRQTAEPLGEELLANTDFETDTSGWFPFGAALLSTTDEAHTGSGALRASERADTWQGPATSLTSLVTRGATYRISAFVKVGEGPAAVQLVVKSDCDGVVQYTSVGSTTADVASYTEIVGSYQVPLCTNLAELTLYAEGPAAGVDLFLDQVSVAQRLAVPVVEPPEPGDPVIAYSEDFESGTGGWYGWNGVIIATSTEQAHSGEQSLVVTGLGVGPAAANLQSVLEPGGSYALSYWVLLDGADVATAHVTAATNCGTGTSYTWVTGNPTLQRGQWVELTGNLTLPTSCTLEQLELYVEGAGLSGVDEEGAVRLYVDDVVITQ